MTQFALFATLLVVVVAAFILPPLWLGLRVPKTRADRKTANLAIFRDQLAELEREKAEGSLAEADFDQAKRELQRRLLEETEPAVDEATPASHAPSRKTAIAILLLLPIIGVLGYGMLGNPRALDPAEVVTKPQMTQEQIDDMVNKLAERMKANPDDPKGWLMLFLLIPPSRWRPSRWRWLMRFVWRLKAGGWPISRVWRPVASGPRHPVR